MNLNNTINQLRNRPVTLDCNVFLLYVIGSLDVKHIQKFKRTQIFVEEDYKLLSKLIENSNLIITPNVMTEASNLLESYTFERYNIGLNALKIVIKNLEELFEPSKNLVEKESFMKFGLSDSTINKLCESGIIAITIDLPLFGYLSTRGLPVINFNHIRGNNYMN